MSSIIHEKDYGFAIDILQRFIKSLKSMSDESLNAFFLKILFVWNFHNKEYIQFSLTSFGTPK